MFAPRACPECLQRSYLLGSLAPDLEKHMKGLPRSRLLQLLEQSDQNLVGQLLGADGQSLLDKARAISCRPVQRLLAGSGCWASCRHDDSYPDGLALASASRPPALFGRGDAALLHGLRLRDSVAIVGSRQATAEGCTVARRLGEELAREGITVVSGMAFGIDASAHLGALETGRTVAVLACGPDRPCPAAHRPLWQRIAEEGLVLSEFPPGMRAWRWTFPARNSVVAALAGVTIVVEAGGRSGTMLTAEAALKYKRRIVVAETDSPRNRSGADTLRADGAETVEDADAVLRLLSALSA